MERKTDTRVIRTKHLLNEALLALMETTHFAKITVQDICRRAGINRVTFYKHYQDKYDLLADCYAHIIRTVVTDIKWTSMLPEGGLRPYFARMAERLVDECCQRRSLIHSLMMQENSLMHGIIEEGIKKENLALVELLSHYRTPRYQPEFIASCIGGTLSTLIVYWLRHEKTYPRERFVQDLVQLIDDMVEKNVLFTDPDAQEN